MIIPISRSDAGSMLEIRRRRERAPKCALAARLRISVKAYSQIIAGKRDPNDLALNYLGIEHAKGGEYKMRVR